MDSAGIVSTLAEQMLEAKARAEHARAGGRDARSIEAIDRSLRRTLSSLVQLRDPRLVALKQGFSLVVNAAGEARVRQQEWVLPVTDRTLQSLLGEAGVRLVPGQVILLDLVLVKILVEEALAVLSQKEAELRGEKARLVHASLELEGQELGTPRPAAGGPTEAA